MDIARELKLKRSPLGTQLTVICIFHVELPDPLPRRVVLGCPLTDDPDTVKQTGYEFLLDFGYGNPWLDAADDPYY